MRDMCGITTFLEILDGMKHGGPAKGESYDDAASRSPVLRDALELTRLCIQNRKSLNYYIRQVEAFSQPKMITSGIPWESREFVADENVPPHFGGIRHRPTPEELSRDGLCPATTALCRRPWFPESLRDRILGETRNDGAILVYAGSRGIPLVTKDVIMALRFRIRYPRVPLGLLEASGKMRVFFDDPIQQRRADHSKPHSFASLQRA